MIRRSSTRSSATSCVDEQMPGPRDSSSRTRSELLPTITLDELNHLAKSWGGEHGRVIAISAPSDAKMPSEADVRAIVAEASQLHGRAVEGRRRRQAARRHAAGARQGRRDRRTMPPPTRRCGRSSNGIKVVVKPTTFQNDEIAIQRLAARRYVAGRRQGLRRRPVRRRRSSSASGVGDFDPTALRKALAGKVVTRQRRDRRARRRLASGSTRPADLETALQLALPAHRRRRARRARVRARGRRSPARVAAASCELRPRRCSSSRWRRWPAANHLRRRPARPR